MTAAAPRAAPPPTPPGDPVLSGEEFALVARLAKEAAGLHLSPTKNRMIYSRVAKRARAHHTGSVSAYCETLAHAPEPGEVSRLVSALTTNVTHFHREPHHFDTLRREILPGLLARAKAGAPVRLWSAGCSEGMEAYSMAMEVLAAEPAAADRDLRILGTDIDADMIARARAGLYAARDLAKLPGALREAFFSSLEEDAERFSVRTAPRRLVRFNRLNLIGDWPMRHRFDVVFCRNVMIYFDAETRRALWRRLHAALAPGGWVFIGHSERLDPALADGFVLAGTTTYRRIEPRGDSAP